MLIAWTHSICIALGFVSAKFVIFRPKGTRAHVRWGQVFWASMMVASLTSFFIRPGQLSPIHILSAVNVVSLVAALYATRRRPRNWRYIHAASMGSAYISIWIAGPNLLVRKVLFPRNLPIAFSVSAVMAVITMSLLAKYTLPLLDKRRARRAGEESPSA
ncbi:MAG: hypothetical protein H6741_12210 [Alphaproteobacteria bacterium]|nr:hypothetical protein [Alphaproteobacteria bacterium]